MNATINIQAPSRSLIYRIAVFAYGVAAYAIGVGALVELILVMLGVFHFTGGPLGQLGMGAGIALDLSLLVAFALQHSVMARPGFKARWTRFIPAGFTVYVWIGVFFEERSLQRQWGHLYEEYRERVGTIVPSFTSRV